MAQVMVSQNAAADRTTFVGVIVPKVCVCIASSELHLLIKNRKIRIPSPHESQASRRKSRRFLRFSRPWRSRCSAPWCSVRCMVSYSRINHTSRAAVAAQHIQGHDIDDSKFLALQTEKINAVRAAVHTPRIAPDPCVLPSTLTNALTSPHASLTRPCHAGGAVESAGRCDHAAGRRAAPARRHHQKAGLASIHANRRA